MRRATLLAFPIGGLLGLGAGFGVGLFAFPFLFPPPPAMETLAETERARAVATGTFIHADPSDPVHYGSGRVTVTERSVFLESDFDVGPGPAFHVYLVAHPQVRRSADVRNAAFVDLGRLRAFQGSQRYAIPPGTDLARYPSVVIWCRQFSVLISPADLARVVAATR
jgi:hypothetical protein